MVSSWFEDRFKLRDFFSRPLLPRGSAIWYYFPGLFAMIMVGWQAITGILLVYYTPYQMVSKGGTAPSLLRDMHWLGAKVLLITMILHFLRNLYHGTYRKPGEFHWITGMLLLLVVCFSLGSGSVLLLDAPHDENLMRVAHCIKKFPSTDSSLLYIHSPAFRTAMYHLYVLHTSLLPLVIVLLIVFHLWTLYPTGITKITSK
jgi:quinol-cytochrome oxidoreductase complex cytochrome b subunit